MLAFLWTLMIAADVPLDLARLELKGVKATVVDREVKLAGAGEDGFAFVKDTHFKNGTIEVDVAGAPAKGAGEGARGFIGIAFRVQADRSHGETFYIRPTNGRAADQLRRNHSTQYVSFPDWPWERLRQESPGVYESYADMVPGEWTHLKVVVQGKDATLYVGGASQPCLLIHDLKLGEVEGGVALWIGPGTDGSFRNLKISDKLSK